MIPMIDEFVERREKIDPWEKGLVQDIYQMSQEHLIPESKEVIRDYWGPAKRT